MLAKILSWILAAVGVVNAVKQVIPGASDLASVIVRDLTNDAAEFADYENGQAVVFAHATIPGETQRCVLVALKEGGPAYASLFG